MACCCGRHGDARLRRRRACSPRRPWAGSPASASWSRRARCSRRSAWAMRAVTGGALFYLVSSTLAIGAFFLLIELIERGTVRAPTCSPSRRKPMGDERTSEEAEDEEVGVGMPGDAGDPRRLLRRLRAAAVGLPPLPGSSPSSPCWQPCWPRRTGRDGRHPGRHTGLFVGAPHPVRPGGLDRA